MKSLLMRQLNNKGDNHKICTNQLINVIKVNCGKEELQGLCENEEVKLYLTSF